MLSTGFYYDQRGCRRSNALGGGRRRAPLDWLLLFWLYGTYVAHLPACHVRYWMQRGRLLHRASRDRWSGRRDSGSWSRRRKHTENCARALDAGGGGCLIGGAGDSGSGKLCTRLVKLSLRLAEITLDIFVMKQLPFVP